jgi:hypothetical protein
LPCGQHIGKVYHLKIQKESRGFMKNWPKYTSTFPPPLT